jgi:hypothetical protein
MIAFCKKYDPIETLRNGQNAINRIHNARFILESTAIAQIPTELQ